MTTQVAAAPTLIEIERTASRLAPYISRTPSIRWSNVSLEKYFGNCAQIYLKLELLQHTGSFKARAAVNNVLALSKEELRNGVTAVSSGNHGVATAYAASHLGTTAKIVMLQSANSARLEAARRYGAMVLTAPSAEDAFRLAEAISDSENRTLIHPFEGHKVTAATATCGVEFINDVPDLDAVIVPIGGGGLCSGIAVAFKALKPTCKVYGVEPIGSAVMSQSIKAGYPKSLQSNHTIANSLAPHMTTPFAYAMCSRYVDEIALVDDEQLAAAAALIFRELKLAVEPAAAAATAAALGPLRSKLQNKRIGIIVCGTNIDVDSFHSLIVDGNHALKNGCFALS